MRRTSLLALGLFAAVVLAAVGARAESPEEKVIYDESKDGDFSLVGAEAEVNLQISEPGIHVIQGSGIDVIDDSDAFVFEVTGNHVVDFCLLADPAEFKKLRAIDAEGKVSELAFGSTNPRFGAPRNIFRENLPAGRYHVEMYFGPQGANGDWVAKIGVRDPNTPVELTCVEPVEPTVAEKMKEVKWPGIISIYHGSNWGDDENYLRAIQEAGFGATGCSEGQIEQVGRFGMKAYVFIWPHEASIIPPKYRDSDTVLCYYMSDRISPSKWAAWANMEKVAYKHDPHHPAVFTMYALMGGIAEFPEVVRGRLMEFYQYHWDANRSPHMYYAVLEQYRQASIRNGHVPICHIAETRAEDPRKTRQTIYTSLVYGVRGFRTGGPGLFDPNKRDERGVPSLTVHGEEALRFNQAIKAYSPVFETARSVDVFHTGPLPPGTKEAPADYWVRPAGEHIAMGEFADPESNRFLMLANRDAFAAHDATLRFTEAGVKVDRMDKVSGEWQALEVKPADGAAEVVVPLEEGGGELLRVTGT